MRLILLRHGETLWNIEKRLQGHDNSPLSERGVAQARAIAASVRALAPPRVVSSDLGRARQTARLIGHGEAPADSRLRELDMGVWTGLSKDALMRERPREYSAWRAGSFTPAGGETWSAFTKRVHSALVDLITAADGDLLAVVHSGVVRAACAVFFGLEPGRIVPVTPGTLTLLEFDGPHDIAPRLEAYNIGALTPDLAVAD